MLDRRIRRRWSPEPGPTDPGQAPPKLPHGCGRIAVEVDMPKKKPSSAKGPSRPASSPPSTRTGDACELPEVSRELTEVPSSRGPVMVDQGDLYELVGYSCRRAHTHVLGHAAACLAAFDLPPGWFTVLILLARNPGLSSRQLCQVLGVKPPNFVALAAAFESRGLIERRVNPQDRRSLGLYLTPSGRRLVKRVREDVLLAEREATSMLDDEERKTLLSLLRRVFERTPYDLAPMSEGEADA